MEKSGNSTFVIHILKIVFPLLLDKIIKILAALQSVGCIIIQAKNLFPPTVYLC